MQLAALVCVYIYEGGRINILARKEIRKYWKMVSQHGLLLARYSWLSDYPPFFTTPEKFVSMISHITSDHFALLQVVDWYQTLWIRFPDDRTVFAILGAGLRGKVYCFDWSLDSVIYQSIFVSSTITK